MLLYGECTRSLLPKSHEVDRHACWVRSNSCHRVLGAERGLLMYCIAAFMQRNEKSVRVEFLNMVSHAIESFSLARFELAVRLIYVAKHDAPLRMR